MGFIKFLIGCFLIVGSLIFAAFNFFGVPLAEVTGHWFDVIFWYVIDFIALVGGIYLVRHH